MIANDLKKLFERDLGKLKTELESYSEEELLWVQSEGINNSAGNLFMHVCGNLQHFIGAVLEKNGYKRNREFEFEGRLSSSDIKKEIESTLHVVLAFFEKAMDSDLDNVYPIEVFDYQMSISFFLMHLHGHLNYHIGQINYHRRILSED